MYMPPSHCCVNSCKIFQPNFKILIEGTSRSLCPLFSIVKEKGKKDGYIRIYKLLMAGQSGSTGIFFFF